MPVGVPFIKQNKTIAAFAKIALVMTDQHHIHNVRERGYVESPARIRIIRQALEPTNMFDPVPPAAFNDSYITSVHDPQYVQYFRRVCANTDPETPFTLMFFRSVTVLARQCEELTKNMKLFIKIAY